MRKRGSQKAQIRAVIRALVEHGSITTTKARAKRVQIEVERLMGMVRVGTLSSRRRALAKLGNDKQTTKKLFGGYKDVLGKKKSGFTRVVSLPNRKGDNAQMARLEFVRNEKNISQKTE